jgi:hypothetical protein
MTTLSEAFAAQAASDMDAFDVLEPSSIPHCHRLHYLQMWLEKLCKAYLWLPHVTIDGLRTNPGKLLLKAAIALTRNPAVFIR